MKAQCGDIEVAWFEVGRGDPLVLIHGLADDHRAWRKVLPWLVMRHRVVLYDFRGHGDTTLGHAEGSLRQLSGDLVALMDALGLQRAALAGFSLGGTIAMRTAIDHPDRVSRLFPVATSSRVGSRAAGWYRERAQMVEERSEALGATIDRDTADVYANAPAELEDGLAIRRQSTRDPRGYGNACRAMAGMNATPLDGELGRVRAPTLVIASDLDQHCPPRAAEMIASAIPGARLEIIEGAGHPIPLEKPAELAELITSPW
jgi:pimeloyl-ACP methyl ester carboxylesterase